ncbi:MAG: extracellular solute-binding protein [Planctomycetota bacterium]
MSSLVERARTLCSIWATGVSGAVWTLVVVLAVALVLLVATRPASEVHDATMWTHAAPHYDIYIPAFEEWNQEPGAHTVGLELVSRPVMDRRLLGGFLGSVPVADLIEAERSTANLAFAGPPEAVGFLDLTDRLNESGLIDIISPPSFAPWTYRGRIYGLPHDIHPVLLGYRADLVEAAGIDLTNVQTWDDLFEAFAPLQADADNDGRPDRYALSLWDSNSDHIETLLLQGGGGPFLPDGTLAIDRPINARLMSEMVSWMVGPDRVTTDVPEFSPTGNQLKLEGAAIAYLMPDWMCNIWRRELPQLSGKVKVMPLPAWEPGGRRTSVWGGSMLGIARAAENHDELWSLATRLYTSDELARELYRAGDIITPVESLWDDPIFDAPDDYFGGQPKGRLYIEQAPDVPRRAATPFFTQGKAAMQNAVSRLRGYAESTGTHDAESLLPEAERILEQTHEELRRVIARNVFHIGDERDGDVAR